MFLGLVLSAAALGRSWEAPDRLSDSGLAKGETDYGPPINWLRSERLARGRASSAGTESGQFGAQEAPEYLSQKQFDAMPRGAVSYGPRIDGRGNPRARLAAAGGSGRPQGHVAVAACTLVANDPYLRAPGGRKGVFGPGLQQCALGLNEQTQACLYKQHHFLFASYFKKTTCGRSVPDRYPTFRPVEAGKPCVLSGTGRWRTVILGSIFYNGPDGPRRYNGTVRSQNDKSFSYCN